MSKPRIGLITVLYNTPSVLDDFFYSLSVQDYENYHLYIIDNSSESESLLLSESLIEKYDIKATIINNHGNNIGVAAGNNQGIKKAFEDECDYILLLNNDLIFNDINILTTLVNTALEGHEIVSPLIINHPEGKVWYAGGVFNEYKGLAPHLDVGKNIEDLVNIKDEYTYAPTCFLLLNKNVFDKIGLMDELYFAYYDDTDFLYRAYKAGFCVRLERNAIVSHKVSVSTGGSLSFFSVYYLTRNRIIFINKNFNRFNKYISLIYTFITSAIKIIRINNKLRSAIFKGVLDGFKKS